MAIATYNWIWQEGEDLVMSLVYKEGPSGSEVPIDLTGYQLRMDLVKGTSRLYTFNSDDIVEVPSVDETGITDNEATLGSDGSINIIVPRSLTLGTGAVAVEFVGTESLQLNYDVFLRSPAGLQTKILRGSITVERSYTKWA
jgi:hypothetical protein